MPCSRHTFFRTESQEPSCEEACCRGRWKTDMSREKEISERRRPPLLLLLRFMLGDAQAKDTVVVVSHTLSKHNTGLVESKSVPNSAKRGFWAKGVLFAEGEKCAKTHCACVFEPKREAG